MEVTGMDRPLTVGQVAERLGTGERFVRRLIEQRRIRYVKHGRGRNGHVRIYESDLEEYRRSCTVEPVK